MTALSAERKSAKDFTDAKIAALLYILMVNSGNVSIAKMKEVHLEIGQV
jgi:hypothetical protein